MIQFHKLTMEDAILKTLKDDRRAAGVILDARNGDTITCSITYRYEVPANFAKAVLADHVRAQEQSN